MTYGAASYPCTNHNITIKNFLQNFASVQDGIYKLGKAHMCSTLSLRSFPSVAFEMVPVFVWLTVAFSHPFKEDRPSHASSFQASYMICGVMSLALCPQAPQHFRSSEKQAICEGSITASVSARSFPFTLACSGQYTHRSFWRWMLTIDTFQSAPKTWRVATMFFLTG